MNTYLVVWNAKKWPWLEIEDQIDEINRTGKTAERWSCGHNKSIEAGNRIFLVKVGSEPKGIVASGFATSSPYTEKHWQDESKDALYINIDFDVLLNPEKDAILTLELLRMSDLSKQNWTPQSSGISIKPELVDELEGLWFDFLSNEQSRNNPFKFNSNEKTITYNEGATKQVLSKRYERNPFARKACLEKFGYACTVCNFNFEENYGEIGKNFIHVHHLTPVATLGKPYEIDPKNDLTPVCPNCHAIIHKRNPPFTIEEVKAFISTSSPIPSLK